MDRRTLLLAVAIAVGVPSATYLFTHRYEMQAVSNSPVPMGYVLDRWTGKVRFIAGDDDKLDSDPMSKTRISEDQYIVELNEELRRNDLYEAGMSFAPFPPDSKGKHMSGYSTNGPLHKIGVFAIAAHKVAQRFELDV